MKRPENKATKDRKRAKAEKKAAKVAAKKAAKGEDKPATGG